MTVEGHESALVARHEIIGLAAFGQGQQKIIRWIERTFDARQRIDILGELLDLIDQAADLVGLNQLGDPWLVQRGLAARRAVCRRSAA